MYEGYNNSLPLDSTPQTDLHRAYGVALDNYQTRLSGESLPETGLPHVFDILVNGYGIDYQTALTMAERARNDAQEILNPETSFGTLDT